MKAQVIYLSDGIDENLIEYGEEGLWGDQRTRDCIFA